MKTKILSLALALIMIVSVAVALPVSADASDVSVNFDFTNLKSQSDGVNTTATAYTVYTNNSMKATSIPEGADWVDDAQPCGFYKATETYGTATIDVPVAGYYDISIAYGSPVDAWLGVRYNSAFVQERVTATGAGSTADECTASKLVVAVKEFSRKLYLDKGEQTLRIYAKPDANANAGNITFYAYNMLLEYSADQTTVEDTIMAADFNNKTHQGGGDISSAPADNQGWIPAGLGYLATTSHDSEWTVYVPADGYYELSVAAVKYGNNLKANILYDDAKIASAVALCTGSANSTDAKVVTTERFMAMKGLHKIKLDYTAGNDYVCGLKLSWSVDQAPEPVDISFAGCTAYSCHVSDTVFGGIAVPEGCDYDWVVSTSKRCYYGQTSLFQTSVTMPKTGYYDVLVATTSLNNSTGYVYGGGQCAYGTLPATGDKTQVVVTNLGRIYLGKGTQGINFQIAAGAGSADQGGWGARSTDIFDMRLQYSEDEYQITPDEIIVSASAPSKFAIANKESLGEKNRHTWPLDPGTNKCTWATNGASKVATEADWYEYDVYAPVAGYYDLYTATCSVNDLSNSLLSITVEDTLYVEASAVTDSNNKALNTAAETYFGRVYLNEGINTVRVEGDANSSAYYFFNLKLSPALPGEEDKITLLGTDNNALEENVIAVGDQLFAEVSATEDVKLFIVNYEKTADGIMKLRKCTPAEILAENDGVKIYRTPLFTSESIVKVFLWRDGTFAPVDIIVPTVN